MVHCVTVALTSKDEGNAESYYCSKLYLSNTDRRSSAVICLISSLRHVASLVRDQLAATQVETGSLLLELRHMGDILGNGCLYWLQAYSLQHSFTISNESAITRDTAVGEWKPAIENARLHFRCSETYWLRGREWTWKLTGKIM